MCPTVQTAALTPLGEMMVQWKRRTWRNGEISLQVYTWWKWTRDTQIGKAEALARAFYNRVGESHYVPLTSLLAINQRRCTFITRLRGIYCKSNETQKERAAVKKKITEKYGFWKRLIRPGGDKSVKMQMRTVFIYRLIWHNGKKSTGKAIPQIGFCALEGSIRQRI